MRVSALSERPVDGQQGKGKWRWKLTADPRGRPLQSKPKNGALADVNWPIFKKIFLQRPLENRSIDSNQLRRGSSKAAARLRQGSDEAPTTFATSWTFPIDSDLILTVVWWKPVEPEDVNH